LEGDNFRIPHQIYSRARVKHPNKRDYYPQTTTAQSARIDLDSWQWFSSEKLNKRVSCSYIEEQWVIELEGWRLAASGSFDSALHAAYAIARALAALGTHTLHPTGTYPMRV